MHERLVFALFFFFSKYVCPLAIPLILISLKRTKSCYFVLQNDKHTRNDGILDEIYDFWCCILWWCVVFCTIYEWFSLASRFLLTHTQFLRIPYEWWIFDCVSHVCFWTNKIAFPSGFYSRIYECYVKLTFQREFFVSICGLQP